jgi:hypothetical protein
VLLPAPEWPVTNRNSPRRTRSSAHASRRDRSGSVYRPVRIES